MIINPGTNGATNFTILSGSPTGVLGGGAGDKVFDEARGILYICTTGGSASTAVWTSVTGSIEESP